MTTRTENGGPGSVRPLEEEAGAAAPRPGDSRVVRALEEYWEAAERGQAPDLPAFLERHAAIAGPLAECLEGLAFVDAAAGQLPRPVPSHVDQTMPLTSDVCVGIPLGDYRLLREVGRGGMGVVYEAEQLSLGRRVALKVLPFAAALDGRQLQRFKTEAQAAARLHHTNIVPVHAVGCERGVHFYAMQFIDGQTLAAVIADLRRSSGLEAPAPELPTPRPGADPTTRPIAGLSTEFSIRSTEFFRTAAQLGLQAAEALDYAHRQEVIHRDIKPANLLVDGEGNLWITDFGLARLQGETGLTVSGDLVGTLRYMSPEQIQGQRALVDHRSDIYSLGATLYELLTLEPAVPGTERLEVLRRIERDEPRAPRRLNRAIPVELQTIVRKAMAKNPVERYATAQELADDLRRFLDYKPIRARRPTLGQRTAKWARRHRGVVVTATVAILVGMIVGLAGLAMSYVRIRQEKAQAEADRRRADRNVSLAMRALDRLYLRVAEELSPRDPQREQENRALLALALAFYEELARENDANPATRKEAAAACFRIANIQTRLGRDHAAREAYERGLALSAQLAAEHPTDFSFRSDVAMGHHNLARLLKNTGDRPGAAAHYRQALEIWTALAGAFPTAAHARHGQACCHNGLGILLGDAGDLAEAELHYQQGAALAEHVAKEAPAIPVYRESLAAISVNFGNLLKDGGRPGEAEVQYRRALDLYARLAVEFPKVAGYRAGEAMAARSLAALLALRDPEAARASYGRALNLQMRLVADFPAIPEYRFLQADTRNMLGILLADGGDRPAAAEQFRQARELIEKLAEDYPQVTAYRQHRLSSHLNLGTLALRTGEHAVAERHFRKALELAEQLAGEFPTELPQQEHLAISHQNLADLLESNGDWAGAERQDRMALETWASLATQAPAVPRFREQLALRHQHLGDLSDARGEQAEAAEHFHQAVTLWTELIAAPASGKAGETNRAVALNAYARFLATAPEPWRHPEQAMTLAKPAVAALPKKAEHWATLGIAQYRAGRLPEALASLERAGKLRPGHEPEEELFLAMIHVRQGAPDKARLWFDEAVRFMDVHLLRGARLGRCRAEAAVTLGIDEPPWKP